MNDHDMRDWLLDQSPARTPERLDAGVIGAAQGLLAERRRRHSRRVRMRWLAAAAALLVAITLVARFVGDTGEVAEQVASRDLTLEAQGGGTFRVADGSRFRHRSRSEELHLSEGEATASCAARPLELSFPAGSLHVERGEGKVQVLRDGEQMMNSKTGSRPGKKLAPGAAIVVVAMVTGAGWLEITTDDAQGDARPVAEGDEVILEVEPTATGAPGVTSVRRPKTARAEPPARREEKPALDAVFVDLGAEWRYRAEASAPPRNWSSNEFDDSAWPSGPAELGFGDGDEATILFAGTPDDRFPTVYFRRDFEVEDPERVHSLTLSLRRDDGARVILNGAEILRSNLPEGPITHTTLALETQNDGDETFLVPAEVDPRHLVAGRNVVAVEVHQASRTSSDLSFDLRLGTGSPQDIPEPVFRGRLVDAESGEPIVGARAVWSSGWTMSLSGDGTFRGIRLKKPGRSVDLLGPEFLRDIEPDARLSFPSAAKRSYNAEARTDERGVFELRARRDQEDLILLGDRLLPWAPDIEDDLSQTGMRSVAESEEDMLEFPMLRSRRLLGQLVTSAGDPIPTNSDAKLEVSVELAQGGWTASWWANVTKNGTFEIGLPDIEKVTLFGAANGFSRTEHSVAIESLEHEVKIPLTDHPRIAGRIVDEGGDPIEGVSVEVRSRKRSFFGRDWKTSLATSDAEGEYICNVHGSVIELRAVKLGFVDVELEQIESGRRDVDIVMPTAYKSIVAGRVIDARGEPMVGARVVAVRSIEIGESGRSKPLTGESGEFSLELWPGRYTLIVDVVPIPRAKSVARLFHVGVQHAAVRQEIEVVPGETLETLEIVVPDGARILGRLVDEEGEPRTGSLVYLYRPDLLGGNHTTLGAVTTDDEGGFDFRGLKAGAYSIYSMATEKHRFVRISAEETLEIEIGGAAASLTGRIVRGGLPVANAEVAIGRIEGSLTEVQRGRSEEDGTFGFENLSYGRFLVHAKDPTTGRAMIDVVEVNRGEVDHMLEWPTNQLTIRRRGGVPFEPEASVVVEWTSVDGVDFEKVIPPQYRVVGEARRGGDGSYVLEGVGAGRFRVRAKGKAAAKERSGEIETGHTDAEVLVD